MNLNHLNLRVRDAVACRDFYERHFGFELAFEAEGGYFVRNAEGFLLALVPTTAHTALPAGFHIGFGLDGPATVRSAYDELRAAGVTTSELQEKENYVSFRCWDPDDTEVEIFWEA